MKRAAMDLPKTEEPQKQYIKFRAVLAQTIAAIISNCLAVDYSMMMAFTTIFIGDLYNNGGPLSLDDNQASWLGSLMYIFQPIGSTVSGIVIEPMGRKLTMIMVNILALAGWLLMYFAQSVSTLYLANVTMGLAIGFMEAPIYIYLGEITQSNIRGILTAFIGALPQIGYLAVYLLGVTMQWRTVAMVSAAVPVVSALLLLLIPESPMWLLTRDRTEEAMKALCWLRGWVEPATIQAEFQELVSYTNYTKRLLRLRTGRPDVSSETDSPGNNKHCEPVTESCDSKWPLVDRLRDLLRADTYRPLLFITTYFFFYQASGISGVRPYMVHTIGLFGMPIDAHWAVVLTAVLGLLAILCLTAIIKYSGRCLLGLISITGCAIACIVLGTYAFMVIIPGHKPGTEQPLTWLPITMFSMLSFFTYFGIGHLSWMYITEIFPLKSRALASGLTVAIAYLLFFLASKTYLWFESLLGLHGVFWLYGACSCVGIAFIYFLVPETEGKSLEEVEVLFKSHRYKKSSATVSTSNTSVETIITLPSN